jgi:hypothetical protein
MSSLSSLSPWLLTAQIPYETYYVANCRTCQEIPLTKIWATNAKTTTTISKKLFWFQNNCSVKRARFPSNVSVAIAKQ